MYTESSFFFDYEHEHIQNLIRDIFAQFKSKKEMAKELYLKVRDGWWYDPYTISLDRNAYKSSRIASSESAHCIEKSVLLISCLRALDIPARLLLGKVKNHIAVERLTERFGTNELTPHGMVELMLDGKWLKCSPAFNKTLCEKFNVAPLDFDGENSSYLQQYNREGSQFMEYIEDYGHFDDVPVEFMSANVKAHYPHIFMEGKMDYKL